MSNQSTVDDSFLTAFRAPVPVELADSVRRRLANTSPQMQISNRRAWRIRLGGLLTLVGLGAALAVSPNARAQVGVWLREVAGFRLNTSIAVKRPDQIIEAQPSSIVIGQVPANNPMQDIDLAALNREFGQHIPVPSYIPLQGTLSVTATVSRYPARSANIVWLEPGHETERYVVYTVFLGVDSQVGVGEAQIAEVRVNNQPAALIRNVGYLETDARDKPTGQVKQSGATMLTWSINTLQYSIVAGPDISDAELIRMAESINE